MVIHLDTDQARRYLTSLIVRERDVAVRRSEK